MKVKTSIYVDKKKWGKFKDSALRRRLPASDLFGEMMDDDATIEDPLAAFLSPANQQESYEINFEPVSPIGGTVSSLVKGARDERTDSILGQ